MAEVVSAAVRPPGQPFTFGGVARYAYARPPRMLAGILFFGLLSGTVMAALFGWRWSPVMAEAVSNLPTNSFIRNGTLVWPDQNVRLLGANSFVSFGATAGGAEAGSPVDISIQFEPSQLSLRSLLGITSIPYPKGWAIELNRTALWPLWGAWEKALPPLVLLGTASVVIASWIAFGFVYALAVRMFALLMGKDLVFGQAWKLSIAGQWPGAVLMSFVLALYAAGEITLVFVFGGLLAHFALTFVYLFLAPIWLPRAGANPFSTGTPARRRNNPFKGAD